MPRFSFPVPGRRSKQEPVAAKAPPLTKVQKVLGSSHINVDSAASLPPSDAARHWDTASNAHSSISINVPESAISYDDTHDGGLPSLTEDTVVDSPRGGRSAGFDEESGVLPRIFADGDISIDLYGHEGRSITDASSLRRKQSGSTIVSYYDKSKVPLGISQQTSNSAMAKGLPTKASSLLDIDGSISQASRRKKKPAKLDLSRMFTNRKSSSTMTLNSDRGLVLSPDMVTRSPSFMSVSPMDYLNHPHSSTRSHHKVRPVTQGSMRDGLSGMASPKQKVLRKKSLPNPRLTTTTPAPPTPSATQEAAGLQNLYAHYEQMTFRDVFAEQDAESASEAPATDSEGDGAAPMSPMSPKTVPQIYQEKMEEEARAGNYLPQITLETPLYKDISAYLGGYGANVDVAAARGDDPLDLPTLKTPLDDGSDSISSRHTRTSKASKRTAQSLLDIDLKQTSVLSLSSDSEDDMVDSRPKTSSTSTLPSPRSQRDTTPRSQGQERQSPTTSRSQSSNKKKDRSSGRSDNTVHFLPVPNHNESPSPGPTLPATAYSRASSASASTTSTTKPSIRDIRSPSRESHTSRVSMASTRTGNSVGPANYTVHEARAITLIPAQGASFNSDKARSRASSSDQPTPPLSPTSMDFMIRSNRTSAYDADQGLVRSANGSLPADSGAPRSPTAGPGRFMAVTRQEELLLAALRKKRLRMRESVIAEFEEEEDKEKEKEKDKEKKTAEGKEQEMAASQPAEPVHEIRRGSIDAVLELHSPQPRSMSAASISFSDFPMQFEDTTFPVPPSTGIRNSLRPSSALSLSIPLSPRSKPPTAQLPPTPTARSTPNRDLDRVLMNMNKPTSTVESGSGASGKVSNSSGSGTGTTSGSGSGSGSHSTPASDRSEDVFGSAVRNTHIHDGESSPRLSDCLNFDDDEAEDEDKQDGAASDSAESYDSFDFQSSIDQSPIDPPATASPPASSVQNQRPPTRGRQQQYLGVAKPTRGPTRGPTLPTVHDDIDEFSDYDEYENVVNDDEVGVNATKDNYPVQSGSASADLAFNSFGNKNNNNNNGRRQSLAQNNSHHSYYGHADDDEQGIPRPDSPLESPLPLPHKRAVRISAVGGGTRVGMEAGWWGHNG
ncbi:hypothetical protein HMPREF1624_00768 [Sporothrix schenckii ATCC 58251]|uniref:Uncharacterized protein n=1 Tax=Sporothrix schenckii (strain ATCC 58251 / de Perez 2211183) TaxID=1391915 RepID=U7Q3M1_SPOS1|nr:hypothetical protein HMPREF1624_00768 [Sporothrix schenckii ATCC 58251]